MSCGEQLDDEALPAVIDGERAIEVRMNVNAEAGVAAASGAGVKLEETTVQWHGVVVLDGALVLEAADAIEIGRGGPPCRVRMRRGVREAGIVPREKPIEHALSLCHRAGLGQPELDHEAILKRAKEALDAPLGLRRMGTDPADAQFLERPADLSGLGSALELLGQGARGAGVAVKDPMPIGVGRSREAIAPDELAQEEEVAVGVLLETEDAPQHAAGGVIDGGQQHKPRAAVLQPGVVAAVQLDQEAGLRHALAAAAMAGRPAGTGTADPGGAKQPLHSLAGEAQALALPEELGEVVIIHAGVAGAGQREDPSPHRLGEAPGRGTAAVAMGESGKALLAKAREQAAKVAKREAQQQGSLLGP